LTADKPAHLTLVWRKSRFSVLQQRKTAGNSSRQIYREDGEGTVFTAIKTLTFQDNRSFPPTKIFVELQRPAAWTA